eukprot:TRINITY_DN1982_c0_g2_i2.p2 TRINITY_DN1982_c0_g2~~TRINITY_DN1982_c0_g2_i2.p2  ORF type:complete len:520 (+),score=106.75 TRINITY_DN1982_c0_g2_i2:52-1611(+)
MQRIKHSILAIALSFALAAIIVSAIPMDKLNGEKSVFKVDLLDKAFKERLDRNGDMRIELDELVQFISETEDHPVNPVEVYAIIGSLDYNKNGFIDYEEFRAEYKRLQPKDELLAIPEQVHLSLTTDPSRVWVMWVTFESTPVNAVRYGTSSGQFTSLAYGNETTYNAGETGWDGFVHEVLLTDLRPFTTYYYQVGDGRIWGKQFSFHTAPSHTEPVPNGLRYCTYGDMGTFMPFGFRVTEGIVKMHQKNPYDMLLHLGDIAYAGTSSTREWEAIWDIFGRQVEPLAANMPYMTTVGNHEKYYNYTAYRTRFRMPGEESRGHDDFFFSFDYGLVHFASIATDSYPPNYPPDQRLPGSEQYNWLEQDLIKAVANRDKVPWIIVAGHRPMYGSSENGNWEDLRIGMEPLLKKYNVDMFLSGHMHIYERIHPIYDYVHEMTGNRYENPSNPVHVVIGTAGAMIADKWNPQPEWSAFRARTHGFSHFEIVNATTLHFQFLSNAAFNQDGNPVMDEFWIVKNRD